MSDSSSSTPRISEIVEEPSSSSSSSKDGQTSIDIRDLMPFIEQTQASGSLSLTDAFMVEAAIKFLTSGSDRAKVEFLNQIPEDQRDKLKPVELASNFILNVIVRGQSRGAFSLSEASKLARILKLVKV